MLLSNDTRQFLSEINQNPLYQKLIFQLNKDFNLSGITLDLPIDATLDQLLDTLIQNIHELIHNHWDVFMHLLYRIDVSENLMTSKQVYSSESIVTKATIEIIKREWQKVLLREQFK